MCKKTNPKLYIGKLEHFPLLFFHSIRFIHRFYLQCYDINERIFFVAGNYRPQLKFIRNVMDVKGQSQWSKNKWTREWEIKGFMIANAFMENFQFYVYLYVLWDSIKNMHKLTMKWKSNWHLLFGAIAAIRLNRIFQVFRFMTISCLCIDALNFKIGYSAAAWAFSIISKQCCFE